MTTLDTVFATNDGALAAGNILKPATGEIELLERSGTNLTSTATLAEDITTDWIYDLWDLGQRIPVVNSGVVHSNAAAVITATANFSVASEAVTTGKTINVTDWEGLKQTITLAATGGTITVTWANGGVITNNTTTLVTVTGANPWTITYTFTAPAGPASVTLTFNATDGIIAATEKTTTVTVAAA